MKISEKMLNRLKSNSNEDWKELLNAIRPSIQKSIIGYSTYEIVKDFIDEVDYYIFEYIQNYYKKGHHVEAGILFWIRQKVIDECRRRNRLAYEKKEKKRRHQTQSNSCNGEHNNSVELIEDKNGNFFFSLDDSINIFEEIWDKIKDSVEHLDLAKSNYPWKTGTSIDYLKRVFMMKFKNGLKIREISVKLNRHPSCIKREIAKMKAIAKKEIKNQMFF
ncbi:MAG: hypothetical protein ACFE95_22775 [Candidatus Hodarchaeota archaeon]